MSHAIPLRAGVVELAKTLLESNVVFIAPTGYGKSKSLPVLLEEAEKAGIAARAIHVLPLRALVRQQYLFLREHLGDEAGYLAGLRLDAEGYSPFMLRRAVVSTLDSFALNLARLPVAELSLVLSGYEMRRLDGHYELPRASIFTSLVVLDEAHLYAEPWSDEEPLSRMFLSTILPVLRDTGTPVVVETATMSTRLVDDIARSISARVLAVCENCGPCSRGWVCIHDRSFEEENTFEWITRVLEGPESAIEVAIENARSGRKVLYAVNTVESALRVYSVFREELGDDEVVLVHGRLSQRDREEAVKGIERAKVVVATQVIEAGVDVDAEVLVAEAAAPSSLAQRAGRLCRSRDVREKCRQDPPIVAVYSPSSPHPYGDLAEMALVAVDRLLSGPGRVEWRLLDDRGSYRSFRHLVEALESRGLGAGHRGVRALAYRRLLGSVVASALGDPKAARLLLEHFCSLVRGTALVSLAVPVSDGYDFIEAPLDWLQRGRARWRRLLDCSHGRCKAIGLAYSREGPVVVSDTWVEEAAVENMLGSCKGYIRTYYRLLERLSHGDRDARLYSLALVLRENAYTPGIGLIAS